MEKIDQTLRALPRWARPFFYLWMAISGLSGLLCAAYSVFWLGSHPVLLIVSLVLLAALMGVLKAKTSR